MKSQGSVSSGSTWDVPTIARSVVVDKHQGTIDFETADGYGTTFIIRLPFEAVPSPDLAAA
jgi:nitrogen-specific signal transduction histidine kinase